VRLKFLLLFLFTFTYPAFASPWIEADDVYFRSNIQLLADSGVLQAPVNSYPLPWALIADEIKTIQPDQLPSYLKTAYYHVRFKLQRAEGKRFNAQIKVIGENSASSAAFGQTNHAQWGIFSSAEYVSDYFAFRANANFAQFHGDKAKFSEDGSYFALNFKSFSLNMGRLERWWGPSWQSTLSQGQNARPMPAIALNYADTNLPLIDNLFVESFVAIVDGNSAYSRKWSNRISFRPVQWLEVAATYTHHWQLKDAWNSRIGSKQANRQQIAADFRISLPITLNEFQPALYGQWQQDSLNNIQDSFIFGFDLAGDILEQQVRFVAEYKKSNSGNSQWIQWLTRADQAGNESMMFGDTFSLGSYIQFKNDHQLTFFIHHEKMQSDAMRINASYRLPLFLGMLNCSLNYTNAAWEKEHFQGGVYWEYRF